jgi:hypothetical protein
MFSVDAVAIADQKARSILRKGLDNLFRSPRNRRMLRYVEVDAAAPPMGQNDYDA